MAVVATRGSTELKNWNRKSFVLFLTLLGTWVEDRKSLRACHTLELRLIVRLPERKGSTFELQLREDRGLTAGFQLFFQELGRGRRDQPIGVSARRKLTVHHDHVDLPS